MENLAWIPVSQSTSAHRNTYSELYARYVKPACSFLLMPTTSHCIELWALLHFIMPSLFDSHDEFNEWFSKDIEGAAEGKGSRLSEHQLRRLHMILKPFMLRRVKRHVQNELSDKVITVLRTLASSADILFVLD